MGEKESEAPGVLVTSAETDSDAPKVHQFNEQTNYVPKRKIITVIEFS